MSTELTSCLNKFNRQHTFLELCVIEMQTWNKTLAALHQEALRREWQTTPVFFFFFFFLIFIYSHIWLHWVLVAAHGLSRLTACGIFLHQGLNPCPCIAKQILNPWARGRSRLQYSCLENPVDRGAWQTTVHRVTKSPTWLKWQYAHTYQ